MNLEFLKKIENMYNMYDLQKRNLTKSGKKVYKESGYYYKEYSKDMISETLDEIKEMYLTIKKKETDNIKIVDLLFIENDKSIILKSKEIIEDNNFILKEYLIYNYFKETLNTSNDFKNIIITYDSFKNKKNLIYIKSLLKHKFEFNLIHPDFSYDNIILKDKKIFFIDIDLLDNDKPSFYDNKFSELATYLLNKKYDKVEFKKYKNLLIELNLLNSFNVYLKIYTISLYNEDVAKIYPEDVFIKEVKRLKF